MHRNPTGQTVKIVQVHAENGDAIAVNQQMLIDAGMTGPAAHYISRPDYLEVYT